jgi:hypothetical protein
MCATTVVAVQLLVISSFALPKSWWESQEIVGWCFAISVRGRVWRATEPLISVPTTNLGLCRVLCNIYTVTSIIIYNFTAKNCTCGLWDLYLLTDSWSTTTLIRSPFHTLICIQPRRQHNIGITYPHESQLHISICPSPTMDHLPTAQCPIYFLLTILPPAVLPDHVLTASWLHQNHSPISSLVVHTKFK